MNHPHHYAHFTVYSPPPPPANQHVITAMHALNYISPPYHPHHPHHHSAPPYQHSHYYMPTQWRSSTYASRRSSSLSSHPTHRRRKKSITTTSPTHKNRLQQEPFSVTKSFKSTVNWISKTFCFCYSDDIIEFNDHYYKKDEKSS